MKRFPRWRSSVRFERNETAIPETSACRRVEDPVPSDADVEVQNVQTRTNTKQVRLVLHFVTRRELACDT